MGGVRALGELGWPLVTRSVSHRTHSHLKADLEKIPNTNTYFISPFQYLTYIDQVQLGFTAGQLTSVTGKLVKMDESIQPDPTIAAQVTQMEKDLEADPAYAAKFQKIGSAGVELSVEGIDTSESVLGNFVMDTLRRTAKANAAFSTASSFRASIPPGDIRMEEYLGALPYKNFIMTYSLTGDQIKQVLDYSVSKIRTANFSATSGLRYGIQNGKITNVFVLKDPANEAAGFEALDPAKTYTVMTTDYQGKIAAGYKDIFAKASASTNTNQVINDVMIAYIKANSPVTAKLDGRVAQGQQTAAAGAVAQAAATPTAAPPRQLPTTGGELPAPWPVAEPLALALLALGAGWAASRKARTKG